MNCLPVRSIGGKSISVLLEEKMDISYRVPTSNELEKISEQLLISYTAAYQGLMSAKYLSSLPSNHWVPMRM